MISPSVRPSGEGRRPEPLPAALGELVADEGDRGDPGARPLDEQLLDFAQLRFDRGERREEPAAILPLLGGEGGDEEAVLEGGLAHRRRGGLTAPEVPVIGGGSSVPRGG